MTPLELAKSLDASAFSEEKKKLWDETIAFVAGQAWASDQDKFFRFVKKTYEDIKAIPLSMTFVLTLRDTSTMWELLTVSEYYVAPQGSMPEMHLQNTAQAVFGEGIAVVHNRLNTIVAAAQAKLTAGKTPEEVAAELEPPPREPQQP